MTMMKTDELREWDDGHRHSYTYFGGMASCVKCAATVDPGGEVKKPTASSKKHRKLGLAAKKR